MHEAVCTTIEQLFFQYWFDDVQPYSKIALRQGSLHWIGAYIVVPAKTGWVMITPAPNVPGLLQWMVEEGFPEVDDLMAMSLEEVVADVPRLMKTMMSFALTKDANELFHAAQDRHIAFGEVQTVAQVAANPQHEFREFFRSVDWDGPTIRLPGPVARFHGTPIAAPQAPAADLSDIDELVAEWAGRPARTRAEAPLKKPLEGCGCWT